MLIEKNKVEKILGAHSAAPKTNFKNETINLRKNGTQKSKKKVLSSKVQKEIGINGVKNV